MGIDILWPTVLDDVADAHSLSLVDLGWSALNTLGRPARVGVNGSAWLRSAHTAAWYSSHDAKEAPLPADTLPLDLRLSSLLAKLLKLANFEVTVLFDGTQTRDYKKGKLLKRSPGVSLEEGDLRKLAGALGMVWRQSIGEADAELAALASEGIIDYVISDDADALLFGAPAILGNFSTTAASSKLVKSRARSTNPPHEPITLRRSDDDPAAWLVRLDDVEATSGLSRLDLVFIAIVTGGDYEPGLPGCGIDTARSLVQAGVSRSFWEAWERGEDGMKTWRTQTADLLHSGLPSYKDARSITRHPNLASTLLATAFPPLGLVALYATPVVRNPLPRKAAGQINTLALVRLLRKALQWDPKKIEVYFYKRLFPARTLKVRCLFDTTTFAADLAAAIAGTEPTTPPRIRIQQGSNEEKPKRPLNLERFEMWVALEWIERAYPAEVKAWEAAGRKGSKRPNKLKPEVNVLSHWLSGGGSKGTKRELTSAGSGEVAAVSKKLKLD